MTVTTLYGKEHYTCLTIFTSELYEYTLRSQVIIVVAAGNQGNVGNIDRQWLIPVAAYDKNGILDSMSNFDPSIANRGLMAPGVNIMSTYPGGQYTKMSGTSFAAPFVTGGIALLWSIFPNAAHAAIIHSITTSTSFKRRSIIPPLMNAEAAWNKLKNS